MAKKGDKQAIGKMLIINKEYIIKLYKDGKSCQDIANIYKCGDDTIWHYLKYEWGIKIRTRSESAKLANANPLGLDYEKIIDLYVNKEMSTLQLCRLFHCSDSTIQKILNEAGVIRTISEAYKLMAKYKRNTGCFKLKDPKLWKGGRYFDGKYIYCYAPDHPRANKSKYIGEHILIWEKANNQLLPRDYCVHHLNGIKTDNRPENLVAMKWGEHINQRVPYQEKIRELEAKLKLKDFMEKADELSFLRQIDDYNLSPQYD